MFAAGKFSACSPSDPYYSSVTALLHMDGANASTTFTDSTGKNDMTNAAKGNAQISTAITPKFGIACGSFANSGYVLIPDGANVEFGSSNFTIEFWYYQNTSSAYQTLISKGSSYAAVQAIALYSNSSAIKLYMSSNGSSWDIANAVGTGSISNTTWTHIAVTRNGNTFTIWVGGASAGTATSSASLVNNASDFGIGGISNGDKPANGYFDDFRITLGEARYTAAFTPPTTPFPDK